MNVYWVWPRIMLTNRPIEMMIKMMVMLTKMILMMRMPVLTKMIVTSIVIIMKIKNNDNSNYGDGNDEKVLIRMVIMIIVI